MERWRQSLMSFGCVAFSLVLIENVRVREL